MRYKTMQSKSIPGKGLALEHGGPTVKIKSKGLVVPESSKPKPAPKKRRGK